MSVKDQWQIRAEVRRRFPSKPWVDVFSKSDVLGEVLREGGRGTDGSAAAPRSDHESTGSRSRSGSTASTSSSAEAPSDFESVVDGPSDFVRRLSGALAVSSLTEDGVGGLKEALMDLISRHYAAREQGWEDGDYGGDARDGGVLNRHQAVIGLQD